MDPLSQAIRDLEELRTYGDDPISNEDMRTSYAELSTLGKPWCRYCGARVSSAWYSCAWGRETLCNAHGVRSVLRNGPHNLKLEPLIAQDGNPTRPFHPEFNSEGKFLNRRLLHYKNRAGSRRPKPMVRRPPVVPSSGSSGIPPPPPLPPPATASGARRPTRRAAAVAAARSSALMAAADDDDEDFAPSNRQYTYRSRGVYYGSSTPPSTAATLTNGASTQASSSSSSSRSNSSAASSRSASSQLAPPASVSSSSSSRPRRRSPARSPSRGGGKRRTALSEAAPITAGNGTAYTRVRIGANFQIDFADEKKPPKFSKQEVFDKSVAPTGRRHLSRATTILGSAHWTEEANGTVFESGNSPWSATFQDSAKWLDWHWNPRGAVQETLSKNRASVFANLRSVATGKYLCVALLDIVEWAPADQVYLGTRKALRILLFLTDPTERRKGWGHYTVACIKDMAASFMGVHHAGPLFVCSTDEAMDQFWMQDRIGFEPTNVAIPQEFNAYYDTTLLQCIVEKNVSPRHYRDECLAYVPPPRPKNAKLSKIRSPRAAPVRPKFIAPMYDGVIRRTMPRRMLRSASMAQVEAAKLRTDLEEAHGDATAGGGSAEVPRGVNGGTGDNGSRISASSTERTNSRSSRGRRALPSSSTFDRDEDDSNVDMQTSSSSSSSNKRLPHVSASRSFLPAMRAGDYVPNFIDSEDEDERPSRSRGGRRSHNRQHGSSSTKRKRQRGKKRARSRYNSDSDEDEGGSDQDWQEGDDELLFDDREAVIPVHFDDNDGQPASPSRNKRKRGRVSKPKKKPSSSLARSRRHKKSRGYESDGDYSDAATNTGLSESESECSSENAEDGKRARRRGRERSAEADIVMLDSSPSSPQAVGDDEDNGDGDSDSDADFDPLRDVYESHVTGKRRSKPVRSSISSRSQAREKLVPPRSTSAARSRLSSLVKKPRASRSSPSPSSKLTPRRRRIVTPGPLPSQRKSVVRFDLTQSSPLSGKETDSERSSQRRGRDRDAVVFSESDNSVGLSESDSDSDSERSANESESDEVTIIHHHANKAGSSESNAGRPLASARSRVRKSRQRKHSRSRSPIENVRSSKRQRTSRVAASKSKSSVRNPYSPKKPGLAHSPDSDVEIANVSQTNSVRSPGGKRSYSARMQSRSRSKKAMSPSADIGVRPTDNQRVRASPKEDKATEDRNLRRRSVSGDSSSEESHSGSPRAVAEAADTDTPPAPARVRSGRTRRRTQRLCEDPNFGTSDFVSDLSPLL